MGQVNYKSPKAPMLFVARKNLFSERIRLAFVVGLSLAGLTIYTATVEKSREYGIL